MGRKTKDCLAQKGLIQKSREKWIVRLDTLKPEWAEAIKRRQEREKRPKK